MGPRHAPFCRSVLLGLVACTFTLTACIPDKPMEDPTPVGGRPSPVAASPVPGVPTTGSPVAGGVAPSPAAAAGATAKVGVPVKGGDLTTTVNSVDRGDTLLVVNITVENAGADVLLQAAADFYVQYGDAGARQTASPTLFGVPQPRFNGDVKRGQKQSGNLAFQVPKTAVNPVLFWRGSQAQGSAVIASWDLAGS